MELVEGFVQNSAGQAKRTKETEEACFKACRTLENSQSDFVGALQKVHDVAQRVQGDMAMAIERAIEHGEEQAKNRLYILVKQKTTKPEAPEFGFTLKDCHES